MKHDPDHPYWLLYRKVVSFLAAQVDKTIPSDALQARLTADANLLQAVIDELIGLLE